MNRTLTICAYVALSTTPITLYANTPAERPLAPKQHSKASATTPKTSATEVMVVIGSKLDTQQQTLEIPRSMTIINDKHLQNTLSQQISDALRQTPSVSTSDNSRPLAGEINIRGFGNERIHLNVDGVNYQQYSDGRGKNSYFNPLDIDPSIVRAVEITRGADGIAKGSGAIGGQVQVVTKGGFDLAGEQKGAGAIIRTGIGNNPDSELYGASIYRAGIDDAQALHVSRRNYGKIQLNLPDQDGSLRGQSKAVQNDSQSEEIRLKLEQRDRMGDWTSDTLYNQAQMLGLPFGNQDTYSNQALIENERAHRFSQSVGHTYQGAASWQNLQSKIYYQQFKRERLQQGLIILGANRFPFDNTDTFKDQNYGLSLQQQLQHLNGEFAGRITSFISYDENRFDDQLRDHLNQQQSAYYGDSKGRNVAAGSRYDLDWSDWLSVETGLRYDNFQRSSLVYQTYGENKDADWSANFGVTVRPTDWLRLYSRWNQGFRGPNLRELYKKDEWRCHRPTKHCYSEPQPNLKAEQSNNIEVGFGLVFADLKYADQFLFKLNWFQTDVTNYIDTAPFMYRLVDGKKVFASPTTATHRDYSSKNIGQLESEGIEVEMTYRYRLLDIFANFSQVRMDVTGVPNFFLGTISQISQPFENAPQDSANLGISYQLPHDITLTWMTRHTRDMDRLPQIYLDRNMDGKGSTLHHLYLGYQPNQGALQGFALRVGLENITDRTYAIWPDPESKTMPGRNWRAVVSYQF